MQYNSYRTFLNDRILFTKTANSKMNLGFFAKRFGLSQSSLNMILSGKRNLTVENIYSCASALKLSEIEHEFFEFLVLKDQSLNLSNQKMYYEKKLKKIARSTPVETKPNVDRFLLSDWKVPALLIYLKDFKKLSSNELTPLEMKTLAQKFDLSESEILQYVQHFFRLGILRHDGLKQVHLEFDQLSAKIHQKNYIKSIHNEFHKRIDAIFDDSCAIYRGFVFTMRKESLTNFRTDILELYERYMSDIDSDATKNTVVQSLVGLFAVANAD